VAGDATLFKVDSWHPSPFARGSPSGDGIPLARRTLLSESEIEARLKEILPWSREGKSITRTWKFRDFPEALRFINRVGELAESMDHHPDIYNSWATVRLTLTTHDRGGLTSLDFDLAKKIDGL
jgi:4a-hydroxytetrahydrobiopterin dehydratase